MRNFYTALTCVLFSLLFLAIGAGAGHYHGKAETLEKVMANQIAMEINPIALEKLK